MLLDFEKGVLEVPPYKLKTIRKELGKLVTHRTLTCRKVASILGQVRSYLVALPFLRLVTDQLLQFSNLHKTKGWDHGVPLADEFRQQVVELETYLHPGFARKFFTPLREICIPTVPRRVGGVGPGVRSIDSRFLATPKNFAHQLQRVGGCSGHGEKFGSSRRVHQIECDNTVAYIYLKK